MSYSFCNEIALILWTNVYFLLLTCFKCLLFKCTCNFVNFLIKWLLVLFSYFAFLFNYKMLPRARRGNKHFTNLYDKMLITLNRSFMFVFLFFIFLYSFLNCFLNLPFIIEIRKKHCMAGYFELLAEMKTNVDNIYMNLALLLSVVADWKKCIYIIFKSTSE